MGVRFRCHHCEHQLHVKSNLCGRRGICPECGGRFRIPLANQPHSFDVEVKLAKGRAVLPPLDTFGAQVKNIPGVSEDFDDSSRKYLVRPPNGGIYGPADLHTIESWIAENRITADTELAPVGSNDWTKALDVLPKAFK